MTKISNFFAHWKEKRWEQVRKNRATFDGWEPKTVNWICGISFSLSFLLPVYLACTDQMDLLGIIVVCFSPIGLYCWDVIDSSQKDKISFFWCEVCGFITVNFWFLFLSTCMSVWAVAEKEVMDDKLKTSHSKGD